MRPIKFRAWLKSAHRMVTPTSLRFLDNGHIWAKVDGIGNVSENSCELMQYTGLTDENGVDVYEGDVLQWHTDNLAQKDWTGIVRWLKGAFIVDTGGSYQALIQTEWYQHHSRVVGNIYANLEYTVAEGKEVPLL